MTPHIEPGPEPEREQEQGQERGQWQGRERGQEPGQWRGRALGREREQGRERGQERGQGQGRRPGGRPGDRGAASLWLLLVGLVTVVAGMAGAAVGSAVVARHEARTAADLGALAGAARTVHGPERACVRAAEIVEANGGRLTSCRIDGFDVVVTAEVAVTPLPGMTRTATASARAGPVRAAGQGGIVQLATESSGR